MEQLTWRCEKSARQITTKLGMAGVGTELEIGPCAGHKTSTTSRMDLT